MQTKGRQARTERTHARIIEAALELFEQHGFDATSIDQIAERADVARRTFHHYFPSKDAVLFGDLTLRGDRMIRHLQSLPSTEPPLPALVSAARAMLSDGFDVERSARAAAIIEKTPMLLQKSRTIVRTTFESDVVAALRERYPDRAELELRALNGMVFGAVQAALSLVISHAEQPFLDYFDQAFAAMLAAAQSLDATTN